MVNFYEVRHSVYYNDECISKTYYGKMVLEEEKTEETFTLNGWDEIEQKIRSFTSNDLWIERAIFSSKRKLIKNWGGEVMLRERKVPSPILVCKSEYTKYTPTLGELLDYNADLIVKAFKERGLI